jgi:hypothetical protein
MNSDDAITLPHYVGAIAEWVLAQDQLYFERHPHVETYCRPYVPGEVWPLVYVPGMMVLVRLLESGIRTRTFVAGELTSGVSGFMSPRWAISA